MFPQDHVLHKRLISLALAALLLVPLAACGAPGAEPPAPAVSDTPAPETAGTGPAEAAPLTLTDADGRELVFAHTPTRVVALLGSFGEAWLDAGGALIGITEDAVSERALALDEGISIIGSVKSPNLEVILSLEPDFAILSADLSAHRQVAESLEQAGIPYGLFHVEYFSDYLALMEGFTALTGRDDLYRTNGLDIQAQIGEILSGPAPGEGRTALLMRAYSTGCKAKGSDNQTGAILRDLGFTNVADLYPSMLEELSMETILEEDPDCIFVTTMGDPDRALENFRQQIESNPAWGYLTAVQEGRCFVLPQDLFHFKPNTRWGDAYQYIADLLAQAAQP